LAILAVKLIFGAYLSFSLRTTPAMLESVPD
jgi:hypothetical protein